MTIWTVGHSNRSAGELIALLAAHGIEHVVDVRRFPASRRHPQFAGDEMSRWLTEAGLVYTWLGDSLGGHREPPAGTRSPLAGYHAHMRGESFARGVAELEAIAARALTAFLCAEASPERCHRSLLADALVERGHDVAHILSATAAEPHQRRLL